MSGLPRGWASAPLSEIGDWGSGGTPKRTNPAYFEGGTIPWLVIGDLNDGVVTEVAGRITELGLANSSAKLLPVETLLVAMYGSIGKLGITGIPCATNQAIAFCRPNAGTHLRYLFYALKHAKSDLIAKGQGGAQQNISQTVLKAHRIAIAPIGEQRRIAEKLDTVLKRVDACRERLDLVPQILKRFREAVLEAAVSGRLTEGWREDRNVKESTWTTTALGSVVPDIRYGTAVKCSYEQRTETPVLRIPNVAAGRIDTSDLKFGKLTKAERDRLSLAEGDLLVIRSNGSLDLVGRTALVPAGLERYSFAGYLIRLRPDTKVATSSYLALVLASPEVRSYVALTARSTSGVNNLNSEELREICFKLPTLAEQAEVVRRVNDLFAFADSLERRYQAVVSRVEKLTSSVLAKAFRGELVPQDPADEPAEIMLATIRAAHEPSKSGARRSAGAT